MINNDKLTARQTLQEELLKLESLIDVAAEEVAWDDSRVNRDRLQRLLTEHTDTLNELLATPGETHGSTFDEGAAGQLSEWY
jgi:hypothetical protein